MKLTQTKTIPLHSWSSTSEKAVCPVFMAYHDDVIKWKHFPRNWPFVRGIHRSPVNFPHKGQWRGALMFSLIYAWINDWVNNREAGDLRRQHGHYDVIVMRVLAVREVIFINIAEKLNYYGISSQFCSRSFEDGFLLCSLRYLFAVKF